MMTYPARMILVESRSQYVKREYLHSRVVKALQHISDGKDDFAMHGGLK